MRNIKSLIFILKILVILIIPLKSKSQECEKVKISDFPKNDLPSSFDPQQIKTEGSFKYYYGIGVPVDYIKARHLAFVEMQTSGDNEEVFSGSSILLMIYANGFSVKRDLDISIRLACANVSGAVAEIEGRVQHLKDLRSEKSKDIFDMCDDIRSSLMMGYCQSIQSEKESVIRESKINSVIDKWPQKDKIAYEKLHKIAMGFFEEKGNWEVDLSGMERDVYEFQELDALEDGFLNKILKADKCSFVKYSLQDFNNADKKLNLIYSKIMHDSSFEDTTILGTITEKGIKSTQLKWIHYRDAWVEFGRTHCPISTDIFWKTLITNERIKQLEELLEGLN